ncbi:peptidoglycan DD-metalloendopeptidase family protein [Psychroflexus gondwanensis]|uniref:peptidoglycan DD-metalloendopeptidase family protein n=1 Tax=Psychroflexus gondwanensis TaxID=251 RepID=UPI0011BEE585|nr:peptidoglycan DD-metalloendopeptidase family protein [Psychroflexus gondwanensis]TXE21250.1 peptidoglycan DD-metalloendopeptidase family protein [Psychroflexus gondwanensis]
MRTAYPYFALIILSFLVMTSCNEDVEKVSKKETIQLEVEKKPEPKVYGFKLSDFEVILDTVKRGETFGVIMDRHGVTPGQVYQITQTIPDSVMNFRRINYGKPYMLLKSKDSTRKVEHFIYQKSVINYAVVSLDSIHGLAKSKPVTIKQKTTSGVISSSLSAAIDEAGLDYLLTNRFADIYQWSVDFFKLQKGDQFKLIYKEKYIDDTIYAGLETIDAAVLKHKGREFYAFNFEIDSLTGRTDFFDEEAGTLRSFFLKAPLKFSRISSRYTGRRFHPVQRRWKAHKGTDYAAGTGTPIWSTADGVITKASYTSGNGNYVKVRHTNKYSTQYLHMSRRAVKVGQYVKQGEIIGYVGQTGLATGPHVCYRFWVNGRQVDPYKQDLPDAEPMKESLKPSYFEFIKPLRIKIDEVDYKRIL